MPPNLSFEEAAAIPLTFLVVHDMLVLQGQLEGRRVAARDGRLLGRGRRVAAGREGDGREGDRHLGLAGEARPAESRTGLDVGLVTRAADFHDAVMKATGGKGVNLVVNTVGGSVFAECVRSMAFEGRLATVGYVDNTLEAKIDIQALHSKRLTLFGVSNKLRTPEQRASGVPRVRARPACPRSPPARIRPLIDSVYPFEELPAARAHMEANRTWERSC